MKRLKIIILAFSAFFFMAFLEIPAVSAASFFTLPKTGQFKIGQEFDMEIRIDSEGQGFNAAQASISFPKDVLEIKSVDYSPAASVFNFWLEEPVFSNENGSFSFIGGTTSGVISASAEILKITFKAKGSGTAEVVLSNAAITSSDGSGTNILSTVKNAVFYVGPSVESPEAVFVPEQPSSGTGGAGEPVPAPPVPSVPAPSVPPPVQIERVPVKVSNLPKKPEIKISMYPDQEKWYNLTIDFLAQWDLPEDISDVATALNNNPGYDVPKKSQGLFEAKTFEALRDGIWYLHVRFKNNIGWGPTGHYKISIDSMPPAAFAITSHEASETDNPTPAFIFETGDSLSGLQNYFVRVDDFDMVETSKGAYAVSPQAPGRHIIRVRAADNAGNIRENSLEFNVLPIESPVIVSVNDVFLGEGGLEAAGTALPEVGLLFELRTAAGKSVFSGSGEAQANGNWETKIDEPLKKGIYVLRVTSKDERGALSLPVDSRRIRVRERPFVVIAGFEITKVYVFAALAIMLFLGIVMGLWLSRVARARRRAEITIAQRDVLTACDIVGKDIEKALQYLSGDKLTKQEIKELRFFLERVLSQKEKMKKYVTQNIKEIE